MFIYRYFAMFLALSSCIETSMGYRAEEPISSVVVSEGTTRTIYGEGTGFVWTSCEDVNKLAIQQLTGQLKANEKIVQLEWLDRKKDVYGPYAKCLTEQGWAYIVYVFWWPSATKVSVRGKIIESTKLEALARKEEEIIRQKAVDDDLLAKSEAAAVKRLEVENIKKEVERKNAAEKNRQELAALIDLESPLSIEHYSVQPESGEYGQHYVQLILKLKNNGSRRITAYELQVELKTKLGTTLGRLSLTSDSSSILPLKTARSVYSWKDNPFIEGEFYDKLINVSSENLIVTIMNQTVVKDTYKISH